MKDINELIRLHAAGKTTEDEAKEVITYLLNRHDGVSILVNAQREIAMKELNIDPSTDFLPELIAEESTELSFADARMADHGTNSGDFTEYICNELLGD